MRGGMDFSWLRMCSRGGLLWTR